MAKKQLEIPGTEGPVIKEIEEAAEQYVHVRDRRMKLTEDEVSLKANLITVCQAKIDKLGVDEKTGNRIYRYSDEIVILKPGKPNVKVRHASDEEEDEDDAS